MNKEIPISITLISILLLIITVTLFSTWGYQSVRFVLSKSFNVETDSTIYDLVIGIIAMVSSVVIFIGAIFILKMKASSIPLLFYGSIGFLIKNVLDIINDVYPLLNMVEVTKQNITKASLAIGGDIFQLAFWIFILVFFMKNSFREQLS